MVSEEKLVPEMAEMITIVECRKLREIVNTLTAAPVLTKQEYIRLMVCFDHILARMESELPEEESGENEV